MSIRIDPDRASFSAVYWKGGDTASRVPSCARSSSTRLVVVGGDSAVAQRVALCGPGFEIVSFDPKVSFPWSVG